MAPDKSTHSLPYVEDDVSVHVPESDMRFVVDCQYAAPTVAEYRALVKCFKRAVDAVMQKLLDSRCFQSENTCSVLGTKTFTCPLDRNEDLLLKPQIMHFWITTEVPNFNHNGLVLLTK